MPRAAPPRLNRLPQRLDYTLIPAPLDLSLPLVDEKAPLPAIIVTPSSPSHEREFCIAFLAAEPKPPLRQRLLAHMPKLPTFPSFRPRLPSQVKLPTSPFSAEFEDTPNWALKTRARSTLVFAILLFIMACHLLLNEMVIGHPHLEFGVGVDNDMAALNSVVSSPSARHASTSVGDHVDSDSATSAAGGWLNIHAIWAPVPITDGKRSARFVVTDYLDNLGPDADHPHPAHENASQS
ncbi:hypothetical protein EIP91_000905 [Steccherinum ochraceum]|uniref:Uncharacterized protein n=1 Tax=Steccherinum ochraceum TaxID=92696 RepID=A0A4V2MWM8_9APHY|nr:hypothetical protein EIP91_000905 [Steccherinum ochraceum]